MGPRTRLGILEMSCSPAGNSSSATRHLDHVLEMVQQAAQHTMLDYIVRFQCCSSPKDAGARRRRLPFRACHLMLGEASVMIAIIINQERRHHVE